MRAEAALTFVIPPRAGAWGSDVHLRVDVEKVDSDCRGERCGAARQTTRDCDALSSSATSCTLLIYASRHHALRRVFVQEETGATDTFADRSPSATTVLSAPTNAALRVPCEDRCMSKRVEILHYSWQPCRRPIRHFSTGNREAVPLVESSDSLRHPPRGETAVPLTHRREELEVSSVDSGALPSNRPHLFFSSGTAPLEDMLEEEDEGGGSGDRLVLHFDSSSLPTSPPPSASCGEAAISVEASFASANVAEEAKKVAGAELTSGAESLPAPVGSTAAPRIPGAATETSTKVTLQRVTTESVEASVSSAPRRLLLLRSGTGGAPCSLSTPSSTAVQPAAPLSSVLHSAGGSRVLHINTADAAKAGIFSVAPAQKAPPTPLPTPAATTTTTATVASSSSVNVAAAEPSSTLTSAYVEPGAPGSCEGQPFLLSFAYPDCSAEGVTTAQQPQTLSPALAAMKGRRTFAVYLEFNAVGFGEATSDSDAVFPVAHCLRENVASCGWPRENRSGSVTSSDLDAHCVAPRASHGYSIIIGDASRQSCCWMCPLVAAVLPGGGGCCDDALCSLPICNGAGELHAGPLLDVWVRAVSGRLLLAPQNGHRNAHDFPSSTKECAPKDQPHLEEEATKLEGATLANGVCEVPAMSSLLYEPSRPLSTTVFTASRLSQLCCVFTPCRIAMPHYPHPHKHDVLNPRPTRRAMWPSSRSSSLVWVVTQVTQDCIVTHPRFLTGCKSSQPPRFCEMRVSLRYYWLRSDPHQCDALHQYICRVFACWENAASTPFSALSSLLYSSPYAGSDAGPASSPLDIIVTKANPPSLSLRGGAIGTTSTVVVAAEALHAAALGAENAGEGPSNATTTQPATAAGRRRIPPSALRARAAITAAVLQHLMWGTITLLDTSCKGEISRTADAEGRAESDPERRTAMLRPPQKQHAALLEEAATSHLVCAARALALHWVCSSPSLLRNAPTSLMNFLAEERLLLSSVFSVGRLLKEECAGIPKRTGASDPVKDPSTTRLNALLRFQTQYASASFAALGWLSHHAAETQLLREDGLVSLRLHEAERALLRSASMLLATSEHCRLAAHRWRSGERLPFGVCSQVEEPHRRSSRGDSATSAAEAVLQTLLRGKVNVRIEHAAVMNAFMVHLEWTTVGSTALCDAPPSVRSQDVHAKVELPFLLLVFVVADDVSGAAQDSAVSSSVSDDESLTRTRDVGGCTVRLYQVTPFSWHLSAAACTANGFTARTAQLLMHALDLVARRPDVFEEFHVQAVTGLGIDEAATAAASARTRKTVKRSRGRQCGPLGASAVAARRKYEVRAEAPPSCRTGAPLRAGKRRRACVSDDDGKNEGSETSGRGEEGGRDAKFHGDDDRITLVLRTGSSRGFRAIAAAVPSPDGAPARRQRPDGGSYRGSSDASLSFVDMARVMPIVVFRQDAAAPLLEVEVSQASQLAAQLASLGRGAANSTSCNDKEEASRVLYALLDHWIGFSSLHAAAPHYIENLRARQRQGPLGQITQSGGMSAQAGALADRCVLYAYAGLLRSLWRELARLPPSSSLTTTNSPSASSPLTRSLSVDMLRSHVLDPACVTRAIEVAIAEYARQDVECRRRLLFLERDAAAQWDLEEADEDDRRGDGAGSAAGMRRRKPTKQTQQRHRQLLQAKMAMETAAQAAWASLTTQTAALVGVFYAEVLEEFPPPLLRLQSDDQRGATWAEAKSTPFCETTVGGVVPWCAWIPRDVVAAEKSAAFQSSLRSLLQSMKAEEEGQPPPRRGDTNAPAFGPTIRLQLTGEPTTKSTSLRKLPSSLALPQRGTSGASDAVDVDLTVAELAKACAAQLLRAPWHPCLHLTGATSTNMWSGKKRVDKAAPLSVANDDTVAHLSAQLLRASDALLRPRSESTSPTFAPGHVTAAKLALPLAQLMMCAEAMLR